MMMIRTHDCHTLYAILLYMYHVNCIIFEIGFFDPVVNKCFSSNYVSLSVLSMFVCDK